MLLLTGVVCWRIRRIVISPKSCMMQRVVIENNVIIIIQV